MKQYILIVECAIKCGDRYLIIQRPQGRHAGGLLSFAGGKVEQQDEANSFDVLREAIRREIKEELGLDLIGKIDYITSEYFVYDNGICAINNLFYYEYDELPKVTPSENEVPWYGWKTKEEINAAENSPEWLKVLIRLV